MICKAVVFRKSNRGVAKVGEVSGTSSSPRPLELGNLRMDCQSLPSRRYARGQQDLAARARLQFRSGQETPTTTSPHIAVDTVHMSEDAFKEVLRDADAESWPPSSIIWRNVDHTAALVDIPHSIELAQQFEPEERRKIVSISPISKPYPSTEPKSVKALTALTKPKIYDLILQKTVQLALDEVHRHGPVAWNMERVVDQPSCDEETLFIAGKRAREDGTTPGTGDASAISNPQSPVSKRRFGVVKIEKVVKESDSTPDILMQRTALEDAVTDDDTLYPPNSTFVPGTVEEFMPFFQQDPSKYDLVIMDPPWPNRSVRRVGNYQTSPDASDVKKLLASIPLEDKLNDNGIVGVWVTNKQVLRDLVLGNEGITGLFEQWGIQLMEEWVWLKITAGGEPVTPIDGVWRKPWEILLVGRRVPPSTSVGFTRRVLLAVPDLHSRKPNMAELFRPCLPSEPRCLEIFARNLTAGWTSWGNEVLKFQSAECWTEKLPMRIQVDSGNTDL